MKYLIVCGGEIDGDFAERLIMGSGFEVIIAADRGMDFLYEHKITPDIIVGDFDSVKNEALSYFKEKGMSDIHALNPEKDDTDSYPKKDAISNNEKFDCIIFVAISIL